MIEYKLKKEPWPVSGATPKPEPTSVKIHKLVVAGGDNHQALINNLQPITAYEVRMSAVNALGTGPYSSTVALTTSEEG